MTRQIKTERRQYPRIAQRLPVNIITDGYGFATLTHNVSCVGAYCRIDKYIPPFTKVAIRLSLPVVSKSGGEKDAKVECKGVVVRTEDEASGGFNIAIFFNEIKNSERNKISKYVTQFLPDMSCGR